MTALLTAMCERELDDSAPDWVHLFPLGEMTGRDGRRFSLSDLQALIALFNKGAVDLPIDDEHQPERQERPGACGGLDQGIEGARGRALAASRSGRHRPVS